MTLEIGITLELDDGNVDFESMLKEIEQSRDGEPREDLKQTIKAEAEKQAKQLLWENYQLQNGQY